MFLWVKVCLVLSSLYNAQGNVNSQMGVPFHGLSTNSRLVRKLHIALLLPQMPCHFSFCSYHSFLSKLVRIIHVSVSVYESGQQPQWGWGVPEPWHLPWLLGCHETERECWCAIRISGSDWFAPALQGAERGCIFWRSLDDISSLST